jgi:hypothetical protein
MLSLIYDTIESNSLVKGGYAMSRNLLLGLTLAGLVVIAGGLRLAVGAVAAEGRPLYAGAKIGVDAAGVGMPIQMAAREPRALSER